MASLLILAMVRRSEAGFGYKVIHRGGKIIMTPFRGKRDLPGFRKDKEGNFVFDLTEEEQQEVEDTFKGFEGYKFNPAVADDIKKGTTAFALSNYATAQVGMSEIES